ncbi:hypothetical protein B0H14DRAFT_2563801 [Mycena olivaceomarginata]|nr:hypothetical protein B0H14DRAFT_2563801 [Mycena olivaceomarginata]
MSTDPLLVPAAEARAVEAAAQLEVAADEVAISVEESKDAAATEKEIKAKEHAVKRAEAATHKAEAKTAAKEAAALGHARAEYEKEVVHLTKLAGQKRDAVIQAAGAELTKAVTNASVIRRKEEAQAQSARAKADEAAARARLEAGEGGVEGTPIRREGRGEVVCKGREAGDRRAREGGEGSRGDEEGGYKFPRPLLLLMSHY